VNILFNTNAYNNNNTIYFEQTQVGIASPTSVSIPIGCCISRESGICVYYGTPAAVECFIRTIQDEKWAFLPSTVVESKKNKIINGAAVTIILYIIHIIHVQQQRYTIRNSLSPHCTAYCGYYAHNNVTN